MLLKTCYSLKQGWRSHRPGYWGRQSLPSGREPKHHSGNGVFTLPDTDIDTDTNSDTDKMGLQPNCICIAVGVCVCVCVCISFGQYEHFHTIFITHFLSMSVSVSGSVKHSIRYSTHGWYGIGKTGNLDLHFPDKENMRNLPTFIQSVWGWSLGD